MKETAERVIETDGYQGYNVCFTDAKRSKPEKNRFFSFLFFVFNSVVDSYV